MLYCMLTCFTWSHNSLVHAHSAWLKTSSNSCVYKKCLPLTAWLRCLSSCPGLPQRGKLPHPTPPHPLPVEELGRSVLKDSGCWAPKADHHRESKEHSQADQAGEAQTDHQRESKEQPSRPSWRGPFWRIWAAEISKRTTRRKARGAAKQTKLVLEDLGCWAAKTDHSQADRPGEVRFGGFGPLSGQNGNQGETGTETHRELSCDEVAVPVWVQEQSEEVLGRSVLKDLGC